MTLFKILIHCCLLLFTTAFPLLSSDLSSEKSEKPALESAKSEGLKEESLEEEYSTEDKKPAVSKHKYVVFQALNKVSARVSRIEVPLGEATTFQRLLIVPVKAYKAHPEDIPEIKVYVRIYEKTLDGQTVELFSGWMFASSPSSSAMEHPVYDIWITDLIEK